MGSVWTPTRRGVLHGGGALLATGFATAGYAVGVEPFRLRVARYRVRPTAPWPAGLRLRIAALSDIHASEPYMGPDRVRSIAETALGLEPDLIVLLGDYVVGSRGFTHSIPVADWSRALSVLTAPLGVYGILGNHDWWEDASSQRTGEIPLAGRALVDAGIRLLHNEAVALPTARGTVWLAGLGDQLAFGQARRAGSTRQMGIDDLPRTLAAIPAGAPAILLAHEPDIFPRVPASIALTLSGHTHGGQVRVFGFSPVVPSIYRNRFAYGHVREHTDLVVSGGLGYSLLPLRFGVPPEITVVEIGVPA